MKIKQYKRKFAVFPGRREQQLNLGNRRSTDRGSAEQIV